MKRLIAAASLWVAIVLCVSAVTFKFYPYELKLKHAFNLAAMSRTVTPGVQVEITLDSITGYGEASMPPYLGESVESVTSFLSKIDPERLSDPFALEEIHVYMDSIAPGNRAAKAAVDIALHDLSGKLMQQPWYKIWGLNPENAPMTSFTVSVDSPDEIERKLSEAEPYNVIKVKMGVPGDRELIRLIRARTDRPICVDVNQGWKTREEALDNILWLADKNVLFVEQPMSKTDFKSHAWLKERSPLPIVADEAVQTIADIPALAQSYDGVNIKLMKCAGMHEAYKMAVLARALGMKVMIGCMTETSCAVSAAAQLAPLADWADLDGNLLISNDIFTGMKIVDGKVTLNDSPGIGITKIKSLFNNKCERQGRSCETTSIF
ncbi:MAG: dipeptide epimerase [Prevotella sp.]|nr:dipeptide epimerase [Prevotella sp.]MCM1075476.1 dipeptide epimerase [Ruminococcus sp.]